MVALPRHVAKVLVHEERRQGRVEQDHLEEEFIASEDTPEETDNGWIVCDDALNISRRFDRQRPVGQPLVRTEPERNASLRDERRESIWDGAPPAPDEVEPPLEPVSFPFPVPMRVPAPVFGRWFSSGRPRDERSSFVPREMRADVV